MNHVMKVKLINELKKFFLYTFFLFILFGVFNLYDALLLGHDFHNHIRYGYSLIEALLLAKVILIGEVLAVGEKFKDRPLIIHVFYKTLSFILLLLIFNMVEHCIIGWFDGHTIIQTYHHIVHQKINIILAKTLIMTIIFAQFFTILEISRTLGEGQLFALFFKKRINIS